jgi:hypothetical protein
MMAMVIIQSFFHVKKMMYLLTVQKSDDDNEVLQLVVQNSKNQTLDSGQTTAEFGIVSLSGIPILKHFFAVC